MNVAIILARCGSKRIPKKNTKIFCGKPLLAYAIDAAKKSDIFDHVFVSTDCEYVANISREYGAEAPFIRPAYLATDFIESIDVINHAIEWMKKKNMALKFVCCIYPNPFISHKDIRTCYDKISEGNWDYSFPTYHQNSIALRSFRAKNGGGLEMILPEFYKTRSQDLPIIMNDAAQFYWGRVDAWLDKYPIFSDRSTFLALPNWRVQDIDTMEDWNQAKVKFKKLVKNNTIDFI
ncbi:NeuA CMP-N-acetylneuraminic acid synthetase [Burkholderiaceae bacterium]